MAVSIAQYVDLLFKKLQGVAKTANSTVKGASNESIASPAFLRGDVVWMQSDQIPSTAQVVSGVTVALTNSSSIECTPDTTVPPIGGIRPTWLTNETYWISQEFGSTWLPKVFVGPTGAANIEATGTQIFSAGIGGVGEYYFDTQAGVLNFIGETIPTVLTVGNVVYVSGYQYVGDLGVTNIPSGANIGNLNITDTTISTNVANLVTVGGTEGFTVPSGNVAQRPGSPGVGTIRFNSTNLQLEVWDGAEWQAASNYSSVITNQTIDGDGSTVTFALDQGATAESIVVSINGVVQTPGVDYTTTVSPDQITFTTAPHGGDVIQVRFIVATTTIYALINGTSNVTIPVSSGNINMSVGGTANVLSINSTGVTVTGNSTVSGLTFVSPNYITVSSSGTTENLSSIKSVNLLSIGNTGYTTTVNMPATPVDGQVVEFAISGNTVTLVAGTGTLTSSFAGSTTTGTGFKYVYRTFDSTWYRLQ